MTFNATRASILGSCGFKDEGRESQGTMGKWVVSESLTTVEQLNFTKLLNFYNNLAQVQYENRVSPLKEDKYLVIVV